MDKLVEAKEVQKKKKKMVRVSQGEIDFIMATPQQRGPFPRPTAEQIRAASDPADPESLERAARLLELLDSCEAMVNASRDEREDIRRQYLAKRWFKQRSVRN